MFRSRKASPKKWSVTVTWYYQMNLQVITTDIYGPFDKGWKAHLVGWWQAFTIMPSCGTVCEYKVEEVSVFA